MIELHDPVVNDFGGAPFAEHDMACAVCWVHKAVININTGIFQPCWQCQHQGWKITKKRKWFWL